MRLIFVSHSQPTQNRPLANVGGMQRVAIELLCALRKRALDNPPQSIDMKASWRWIYVRILPFLFSSFFRLKWKAAKGDIDTILFSSMVTATLTIPLGPFLKRRDVVTAVIVHGQDVTMPFAPYQYIVRRVFAVVDAVLPVSRATADACLARGLEEEKVFVVHNGVDTSRFAGPSDPRQMRSDLLGCFGFSAEDLPHDALLLCSVGRQVRRKGFAWFVDSVMPRLPERVHYWLAGDGPERNTILRKVEARSLGGRVRLLGKVSDIQLRALYGGSDIFIMPNIPVRGDMEGFGIVMLEAGVNALPTVASRLEGITEVIQEGENGRFVESGDAAGFATVIEDFEQDPAALIEAKEKAHAYTRRTFSWDSIAARYAEVLSGLS